MELGWFTMDMQEGCLWPVTAVLLTRDDNGDILYFPNHVLTPRGGERFLESLFRLKLTLQPRHSDLSLCSKPPIEPLESDSPRAKGRLCPQIVCQPPGQLSK